MCNSRDLGTAIAGKVMGIAEHMLRRVEMDDGRGMFLMLVRQFAQLRGHLLRRRAAIKPRRRPQLELVK